MTGQHALCLGGDTVEQPVDVLEVGIGPSYCTFTHMSPGIQSCGVVYATIFCVPFIPQRRNHACFCVMCVSPKLVHGDGKSFAGQ